MAKTFQSKGQHLPGCYFVSFNDFAEQHGLKPPEDAEWGAQAGIEKCDPDCPVIQSAITLGRELAAKYGW